IGEHLAFATLLDEGAPIRFSGQDSRRGTFSHRHAVLADMRDGKRYTPLAHLREGQGRFDIFDSPLSEAGVLGFDYGWSLDMPEALCCWEAQFGDFANGAQVVIDQFISSAEDKWNRLSSIVLLLPHGFEGQGPEHSSARLERFLQLCAEDNMQVCYPTTPAQFFHLLRRQVVRSWRKPLVVMTPKSLLRHKLAVSSLRDLTQGSFQRIIVDPAAKKAKRVLLCTGKIYYDLITAREEREPGDRKREEPQSRAEAAGRAGFRRREAVVARGVLPSGRRRPERSTAVAAVRAWTATADARDRRLLPAARPPQPSWRKR